MKLLIHVKESHWSHLAMIEYWLKSTSQNQDILKFKSLAIWWKIMFIYTREIAQFKEDIKKSLKKPHQTFLKPSELKFVNQLLKQQKLLDIIMQEQLSLSLILIPINISSWKWTRDFKLSIRFLNKLPVLILFNGNFSLQVDSLFLKSKIKFKRKVMLSKSEFTLKILLITSFQITENLNILNNPNKSMESESKQVSDKMIQFPHSMTLWLLN